MRRWLGRSLGSASSGDPTSWTAIDVTRVLRIHATYTAEGGEDLSVRAEAALLEENGADVSYLFESNADLVAAGVGRTLGGALARHLRPTTARTDPGGVPGVPA